MNVLWIRIWCSEGDLISRLVIDVLQESWARRSGRDVDLHPANDVVNAGTGCKLSAAIACGPAGELTSDFSPLFTFLEINRRR
jgi:hypothetical protein